MPLAIFPAHLFNPQSVKAELRSRVIDGGTSLNGDQDAISADGGGRWYITYDGITLNTPAKERLWKQWGAYLLGGARIVAVPLLSLRTAPRPSAGGAIMRVSDLAVDDPAFPTSVAFASPYIKAIVTEPVALRDTAMQITMQQGARLQGGETFSTGTHRAYIVERVTARSGQAATVTTSPPARAAIADNAALNFEWPTVQAKMVIGQDIGAAMSLGYGTVSISFVEDFSVVE